MAETVEARICEALEVFGSDPELALRLLVPLYDPDVVFEDPIQRVEGLEAFVAMNRRLAARARSMKFQVRHAVRAGDDVFLLWRMDYAPRLGPAMSFEGASHLRLSNGRVVDHRDYFDLLGGVLGAVRPVGRAYRAVLKRVG